MCSLEERKDRASEGGEEGEENENEAPDICLENNGGLNDKTLPMNKSSSGQGGSVIVSIKGDEWELCTVKPSCSRMHSVDGTEEVCDYKT